MYTDAQKRSHIFDLQTFLRRIQQSEGSAAPLVPDGIFGAQTAAAVREYQQQHCLPVTASPTSTWNAIYASYAALIAADALPCRRRFRRRAIPC
ncbi:MAG: peptidoglycan-binding domain-containing protein [Butyricicoccus sp.]